MFDDPRHAALFDRQGYVCFPFLDAAAISAATEVYREFETYHHRTGAKFRGTGWIEDAAIIRRIDQRIQPVVSSFFDRHFKNFNLLGFNFLIKEPGETSAVPLHQDWTYVDEQQHYSMNVWVALEDTDISNGCLFMVPGSHQVGRYYRSSPSYPIPFAGVRPFLDRFRQPVILRAGDCVCFNNKIIHGSYPNLSDTFRLALVTTLYPRSARLLHHYVHDVQRPEAVTEFEIDLETFLTIKRGLPPEHIRSRTEIATAYPVLKKTDFAPSLMRNLSLSRIMRNWF